MIKECCSELEGEINNAMACGTGRPSDLDMCLKERKLPYVKNVGRRTKEVEKKVEKVGMDFGHRLYHGSKAIITKMMLSVSQ